ncbi:MAG: hypothetical protein EOO20_22440 [Chryseobacterium sp.]|nr:MAG: hypothetical protein EOO20_22440 [Chryseobacterium sp.]
MKQTLFFSILLAATLTSCKKEKEAEVTKQKQKNYPGIEKAAWLDGSWGNASSQGTLSEKWVKANDSVYYGESYFIVSNDTVFAEKVKLDETNGKLAYTVSVPGQNNEKPVRFEATTMTDNQLVFENPAHDYPNKITYNKVGTDSLVAEISGTKGGKPASELFKMKKQ